MSHRRVLLALTAGAGLFIGVGVSAARSSTTVKLTASRSGPIKLLPVQAEFAQHYAQYQSAQTTKEGIVPPPTPCPLNGVLPQPAVDGIGVVPNCGIPELPVAAGEPYPGTMSYYGGHVQVHPHEYLVLWGWGVPGAFGKRACKAETFSVATLSGKETVSLKCDPDGAGKYVTEFVSGIGGTQWANVQDQYYEASSGGKVFIDERNQLLAGVWIDDGPYPTGVNPNLSGTKASNGAGYGNTYSQMALEASRAAAHFGISTNREALDNANFIIAQPQKFSDPQAATTTSTVGYCAFHDYTLPDATGNSYYKFKGIESALSYTNMPYTLNAGAGCGQGDVNHPGTLDAYSIGLGHEIQETVTDPGAEDVVGNILSGGTQYYGGWYDTLDGNENGDKCAYVGVSPLPAGPTILPIPGAMGNIKTSTGTYAVQSLWSDASAGGLGWCAGIASTDLPAPFAGESPYS